METGKSRSLPETAYRPLAEGERYVPVVGEGERVPEITLRSFVWGFVMVVVFTVACVYSGLKVGQVMEAAIPISIIAVGVARLHRRRSTILENVIIQSMGGASGHIAAGCIFTIPALYMVGVSPNPVETAIVLTLGAVMGISFIIPLRRYFTTTMHGVFPFPEATAITEVLITGEKGGAQARLLVKAMAIGLVYDFVATTLRVWKEVVDFLFLPAARALDEKLRVVCRFNAEAFILGLGYVMGLRSSAILCAGGFLANFVLVPLIWVIGRELPAPLMAKVPIAEMGAGDIFKSYVRFIGVGAIATAGLLGIVKAMPVIRGAIGAAVRAMRASAGGAGPARTDADIRLTGQLVTVVLSIACFFVFLWLLEPPTAWAVLAAGGIAVLFAFALASIAANAIAVTARNPISGMTMLAIIVSALVLARFGLSQTSGMFFVLMVAAFVCTSLSISGGFITDLKTGYWLGSTPASLEKIKLAGSVVAALVAAVSLAMLSKVFYFGEGPDDARQVLAAPQASIMKELSHVFMTGGQAPWALFAVGAVVTICMEMLGIPPLIFALGMYLPLELNTPALVGGAISEIVVRKGARQDAGRRAALRERGVVIASGFMAGGAIGQSLGAACRLIPGWRDDLVVMPWYGVDAVSQGISVVLFTGLCVYVYLDTVRKPA